MSVLPIASRLRTALRLSHTERFWVLTSEPETIIVDEGVACTCHSTWSADLRDALTRSERPVHDPQARFERGHRCFVITVGDEPAGIGWCSPGEWGGVGTNRPLAADAYFAYAGETRRPFRGRRIAPFRLMNMALEMRRRGYRHGCVTISDRNAASRASVQKVGYHPTDATVRVYRMRAMSWLQSGDPPESLRASRR